MEIQNGRQRETAGSAQKYTHLDTADEQHLLECLKMLPERYQLPLKLHLQEKWSSERIAQYLNRPLGTIESLLWRGKKQLRKLGALNQFCHPRVSRKIIDSRIVQYIERLPRPYRGILQSHYMNGQTYTEMARNSGIPIGTLKSRVHRGKKLLFDFFSAEIEQEA